MAEKTLQTLFHDTLRDVLYAERRIHRALPKMARAARAEALSAAFLHHREETEAHIERLEQVFEMLGKRAQGKTCPAIEGILDEGEEAIEAYRDSPALDAALIASAQAVEHYEMGRYGTLKEWAATLGMKDAAKLLGETLEEERKADATLTGLAEGAANAEAMAA